MSVRPRLGSICTSNDSPRASASCRNGRATASSRLEKAISSASTVTVPDLIFERSRMSLMRLQEIRACAVNGPANSTCLPFEIAIGIVGELLAENKHAVQRCAKLVRHVGEQFGFVLRCQSKLGGLLLQRASRLLDFLVLALHVDVALGELLRFLLKLIVGLLQLALLGLQLAGKLLRLLQQALGLHRGLDLVQHDADAARELLEENDLKVGEDTH